jgi:hypothetical protein
MIDRIITNHDYPPIPVRMFDWSAHRDGYEPGEPIGTGATEVEAIADLLDAEAEREEKTPR